MWVSYTEDGGLHFGGLDLAAFGQDGYTYEYDIVVPADQFAALRRALGVDPGADVLESVCARVETIMSPGEHSWLDEHGIAHSLDTWHSPPD